jgi:hypothetical protein
MRSTTFLLKIFFFSPLLAAECLLYKREALSSNPSPTKKKNKTKQNAGHSHPSYFPHKLQKYSEHYFKLLEKFFSVSPSSPFSQF